MIQLTRSSVCGSSTSPRTFPPAFPPLHLPGALANLIDHQPNATQSGKDKWAIRWPIPRPGRLADVPFLPAFWLALLPLPSDGTYVRGRYTTEDSCPVLASTFPSKWFPSAPPINLTRFLGESISHMTSPRLTLLLAEVQMDL